VYIYICVCISYISSRTRFRRKNPFRLHGDGPVKLLIGMFVTCHDNDDDDDNNSKQNKICSKQHGTPRRCQCYAVFPRGIFTRALTIARSSSNSRQPVPSNLSKAIRPFHRTHTPFIMKCDSMWTCVGKDESIAISVVSKNKKNKKTNENYTTRDE